MGNAAGFAVQAIDDAAHATGVDTIIHKATGGARLMDTDGNLHAASFAVQTFDHIASETGLDHCIHFFTKGARVFNPDGSFNPNGCIRAIENTAQVVSHLAEEIKQKFLELLQQILDEFAKIEAQTLEAFSAALAAFVTPLKLLWEEMIYPAIKDDVDAFLKKIKPATDMMEELAQNDYVQAIFKGHDAKATVEVSDAGVKAEALGMEAHLHNPIRDFRQKVNDLSTDSKGDVYAGASKSGKALLDAMGPTGRALVEGTAAKWKEVADGKRSGSIGIGWGVGGGIGVAAQASVEANCSLVDFMHSMPLDGAVAEEMTGLSSVCASAGVGLEAGVSLTTGPFLALNIDDPPDLGGFGFEIFVGLAVYGGAVVSVNFTIGTVTRDTDAKESVLAVYPSGITIQPVIGFEAGALGGANIGTAFTYKHVILSTKKTEKTEA